MAKSISDNTKRRGRPVSTGTATLIGVRLLDDRLAELDRWIAKQKQPTTRPEAIRQLLELGLKSGARRKPASKASARAAELAEGVINSRLSADATPEERQTRRERLVKGPTAFRDVRKDRSK